MTTALWCVAAFLAIGLVELGLWVLGCELVKRVRGQR